MGVPSWAGYLEKLQHLSSNTWAQSLCLLLHPFYSLSHQSVFHRVILIKISDINAYIVVFITEEESFYKVCNVTLFTDAFEILEEHLVPRRCSEK